MFQELTDYIFLLPAIAMIHQLSNVADVQKRLTKFEVNQDSVEW